MFGILMVTILVGCAHGFAENAHLCDQILKVDCSIHYHLGERNEVVCANDNQTYNNYCFYSQARCRTPTTHILYVGPCYFTTSTSTTTVATTATTVGPSQRPLTATAQPITTPKAVVTTTIDHLMTAFCASKGAINCPTDLDPICGSDGNFYLNQCEFSKQSCDDQSLVAKSQESCISG